MRRLLLSSTRHLDWEPSSIVRVDLSWTETFHSSKRREFIRFSCSSFGESYCLAMEDLEVVRRQV
jgi:hypothetical protein